MTLLLLDLGVISFYEIRDVPKGLVAVVEGEQPWLNDPTAEWVKGPDDAIPRLFSITPAENVAYLSRFLMIAGWPFLTLLAAPALLPGVFSDVPKIPLQAGGKTRPGLRWLGAVAWLLGIVLGVGIAIFLLQLGPWLHETIAGAGRSNLRVSVLIFYLVFLLVYVAMANWPLYRIVSPPAAVSALVTVLAMT